MQTTRQIILDVVSDVPSVRPHLSSRARWMLYEPTAYKTYDYMLGAIEGLVNGVYNGLVGGEMIDIMANLISGQLTQAYQQAMIDEGMTDFAMPDYLAASLEAAILGQYDYVDQYFRDIVDARIDGTSITPLLARAQLWAQRWTESYNEAVRLMTLQGGGNLIWREGDTIRKCDICKAFDGIVARASEWDALGIRPQNAPNDVLTSSSGDKDSGCGGWRCGCTLEPTDRRRSPNAFGRLEEILLAR